MLKHWCPLPDCLVVFLIRVSEMYSNVCNIIKLCGCSVVLQWKDIYICITVILYCKKWLTITEMCTAYVKLLN